MFKPGLLDKTNLYLYHFTKTETAVEKILSTGKLQMGAFLETNDPRETQEWIFFVDNNEMNRSLDRAIKKHCKVLCLSKDNEKQSPTRYFGRGYQRPSLWAHYAENHKGVCLIFDKKKLIKTAKCELSNKGILYKGDIQYKGQNNRNDNSEFKVSNIEIEKNGLEVTVEKMIAERYQDLFFVKHEDWRNECEYRLILRSNNDNQEYIYISITESIKGIILGCDFPYEKYQTKIQEYIANYDDLQLSQVKWYNGLPMITEIPRR